MLTFYSRYLIVVGDLESIGHVYFSEIQGSLYLRILYTQCVCVGEWVCVCFGGNKEQEKETVCARSSARSSTVYFVSVALACNIKLANLLNWNFGQLVWDPVFYSNYEERGSIGHVDLLNSRFPWTHQFPPPWLPCSVAALTALFSAKSSTVTNSNCSSSPRDGTINIVIRVPFTLCISAVCGILAFQCYFPSYCKATYCKQRHSTGHYR